MLIVAVWTVKMAFPCKNNDVMAPSLQCDWKNKACNAAAAVHTTMTASRVFFVLQMILGWLAILLQNQTETRTALQTFGDFNPSQAPTRGANRRKFWVRPRKSSSWWENFVCGVDTTMNGELVTELISKFQDP